MGKKKEKVTESKKSNDTTEKTKGDSFLDSLRPTTGKPETRGTGKTLTDNAVSDKTKKAIAGGIVAVAIGALALIGFNQTSSPEQASVDPKAKAAVTQQQPARAASEAAAASLLPQPLAPQKVRLAEPSNTKQELAKPNKKVSSTKAKVANKAKTKSTVKKTVAANKKQKAVTQDKKSKKTLAAKSID